jgi:hypothetical protein
MSENRFLWVILCVAILASTVSAAVDIKDVLCGVISPIEVAVGTIGPAMVVLMFLYGGVKYVYAADDPGGRKQAKDICIQALIGGIILLLANVILVSILKLNTAGCGALTWPSTTT